MKTSRRCHWVPNMGRSQRYHVDLRRQSSSIWNVQSPGGQTIIEKRIQSRCLCILVDLVGRRTMFALLSESCLIQEEYGDYSVILVDCNDLFAVVNLHSLLGKSFKEDVLQICSPDPSVLLPRFP